MKLPEKKYEPKHNDELKEYALGWNSIVTNTEYLCKEFSNEYAKERLSQNKELLLKIERNSLFFQGQYDCIIEIEKLNKEKEEHKLHGTRQVTTASLDFIKVKGKYICFDEDYTCPIFNKDKWKCQYCINTKTEICPLLL